MYLTPRLAANLAARQTSRSSPPGRGGHKILLGDHLALTGAPQVEQAGTVLRPAGPKYLWTDDSSSLLKLLK
ncbi:MAG: hypothetical protein WCC21_09255 [Candidatus Acidiferrales bacterium]